MKKLIPVLFILLAYLWLNYPTLHDGLFHVYDNVQVTRIQAMYNELSSGQFPVRYIDEFGQGAGYFLFKYYSPFVYYVGAAFVAGGFTPIKAVKLVYLVMTAVGATGMFVLLSSWFRRSAATIGTVVFLTSPYVFHDFFHRGSLTEASALMLIPWLLWAFKRVKEGVTPLKMGVAALTLGLVMITHSLTGVMAIGMLGLYLVIPLVGRRQTVGYLAAIVLGLGLSGFSLVPALSEKSFIQYENNSLVERGYLDHPVAIVDQFFGNGVGGEKAAFAGLTLMVGFVVLLFIYLREAKFRQQYGELSRFIMILSAGGLLLMSPLSAPVWERVIQLRYLQFPFRILTVVTVALTLNYASIFEYFRKSKIILGLLLALLAASLYLSRDHYQTLGYQYGTTYTVDDPCMTTTWANEYMSKWSQKCLLKPVSSVVDGRRVQVNEGGRSLKFEVVGGEQVEVGKYYFPGWVAEDQNGVELSLEPIGEYGLMSVSALNDSSEVTVKLGRTPAEKFGDAMSLTALILLAGLMVL